MGERMKKIFILGLLLCAMSAHAEIPTVQYMLEFYNRSCGWPDDFGFIEYMQGVFQDGGISLSSIPSQWWPLAMIDYEFNNGNTSYNTQLTTDNVISVGFLQDTLNLIDMPICCKNGSQLDPDSFSCVGGDFDANMCRAYIHFSSECPAGWERIRLENATLSTEYCDSINYAVDISDECITSALGNATDSRTHMCLPPVENGTISVNADYGTWMISNGDATYVAGVAWCGAANCWCRSTHIMSIGGALVEYETHDAIFAKYDTPDACATNCASDCATGIQTMPGFRHTVLLNQRENCPT